MLRTGFEHRVSGSGVDAVPTEPPRPPSLPLTTPGSVLPAGKNYKLMVGVADKVTSSKDDPAWLCSYTVTSGQISNDVGTNLTSVHAMEGRHVGITLSQTSLDVL